MTTTAPTRPVAVEELRRAWLAVQAGDFRHPTKALPTPGTTAPTPSRWTPASGERVLPVLGAGGSSGATTVALALATMVEGRGRLVECCSATQSGLAAASTAELGADDLGWRHGSRDQVLIDRADGVRLTPDAAPTPSPTQAGGLTVVDVGSHLEELLAGSGWISTLLTDAPTVVVVARATVPGLRRLESTLHLLGADRAVAAVVGPALRRWPRPVSRSVGVHTAALLADGRVTAFPEDRHLALHGLTPAPLPQPLLAAAGRLLTLTEGNPHD